ncbi:MAG TPA: hypothetical protein VNO55_01660, partial [Polyangia bacterium]|nr:hypothetical protein [Polyangia bacterium]
MSDSVNGGVAFLRSSGRGRRAIKNRSILCESLTRASEGQDGKLTITRKDVLQHRNRLSLVLDIEHNPR